MRCNSYQLPLQDIFDCYDQVGASLHFECHYGGVVICSEHQHEQQCCLVCGRVHTEQGSRCHGFLVRQHCLLLCCDFSASPFSGHDHFLSRALGIELLSGHDLFLGSIVNCLFAQHDFFPRSSFIVHFGHHLDDCGKGSIVLYIRNFDFYFVIKRSELEHVKLFVELRCLIELCCFIKLCCHIQLCG